jgi:hypothetical protein
MQPTEIEVIVTADTSEAMKQLREVADYAKSLQFSLVPNPTALDKLCDWTHLLVLAAFLYGAVHFAVKFW